MYFGLKALLYQTNIERKALLYQTNIERNRNEVEIQLRRICFLFDF